MKRWWETKPKWLQIAIIVFLCAIVGYVSYNLGYRVGFGLGTA